MVMRDIVEEETTGPAEKRPVDSGAGTADKAPLCLTVVLDARVRVVEVREHNDSVVRQLAGVRVVNRCGGGRRERTYDIGHKVEPDKVCEADFASPELEDPRREAKADVGGDDAVAFVGFENRRGRLEMLLEKDDKENFETKGEMAYLHWFWEDTTGSS